jgi:hypothetical protein
LPDVDAFHYIQSRESYAAATEDGKTKLRRAIFNLRTDPRLDPPHKVRLDLSPLVLNLYSDEDCWIIYHFENNWTLGILNMGFWSEATPHA